MIVVDVHGMSMGMNDVVNNLRNTITMLNSSEDSRTILAHFFGVPLHDA